MTCSPIGPDRSIGRRAMVRQGAVGLGAALVGLGAGPRVAGAAGGTDALLLSCMDYRLTGQIAAFMAGKGMAEKYDHVILAGAALGAVTSEYPDWGRTFRQHLDIAIQLHGVHQVLIVDHRDCGAYKTILGKDYAADPAAETEIHTKMLHRARHEIARAHPKLDVSLYLMALDGTTEPIG
jgi:carbonic anhydrase